MKIAEYKQMMAYLTRPKFNGGGYVKKKVLPKKKPEEEVKKRQKINYEKIKQYLGEESQEFIERELGFAMGGRASYFKGGITSLYKGIKGLQQGRIQKELINKYKSEGMNLIEALNKANLEATQIVKNRKLKIIQDKLNETSVLTDDYVTLIDEEIKLNDPELFEDIRKFEKNNRPDLADKMRALRHPDWAEANFGKNYEDVLQNRQNKAIKQMMDDIPNVKERTVVDDIDDMNQANIDEFLGRKKNAEGGSVETPKRGLVDEPGKYSQDQSPTRAVKKYIPYKDKFLKLFEKAKKDKRKITITGLAQETIDSLKGSKNEIKDIDVKNFSRILQRSFLTEKQKKNFLTSAEANIVRSKEAMTPKKIIFQNIIDGKSNIEDLAKASGLSKKEVQKTVNKIIIEIPRAKKQSVLNEPISNVVLRDFKVNDYEKFRKQITNEPTLGRVFRKGILELITDAYKNNPKKLERATKRVNAYFKIKQALEKQGVNLALDHPLAFKTIENLGNTEPEKLIRVTPISQELNIGLKKSFDKRYRDILTGLQDDSIRGENRKKLITDKIKIEKLAKDINLPFGKVAKTGKVIDFGTPEFLKKDLGKEIKQGVKLEDRIIKSLDKIPNIADRFKEVFGTTQSKALDIAEKLKGQKNLPQLIKVINALIRKNPGLAADASDFLNKISDAIVSPVAAAEVLPGEAQAATSKPMDFDLDMSLPTPTKKDITAETTAALTPLVMKYGPSVAKGLGRVFTRMGTPLFQAAYALADPASLMFSAPFTQQSNVPGGVYKKPKGIMQKFTRSANRFFLPPNIASPFIKGLSRASTFGFPVIKAGEELLKTRGRIRDFEQRMTPMERNNPENFQITAAGKAPKELVKQFMRELPQDAFEYTGAAGGGLLKQAGDRSGKPPEAGPTPQGLDFLMKRGRQY